MSDALRIVETDDIATCHRLRHQVFVIEQGVCEADEYDDLDPEAVHLLAWRGTEALGSARLLRHDDSGKIGRVCVSREARGQGIGAALIRAAVAIFAADPALSRVELGAQTHAIGFYEGLGFSAYGPEFDDAGIPHRMMEKTLRG